jgi:hypothetical protein
MIEMCNMCRQILMSCKGQMISDNNIDSYYLINWAGANVVLVYFSC